jgi:hypothetical protein
MAKEDWRYLASHPIDTIKAILLRKETKVFGDIAPTNYLSISLTDAAKGVQKNRLPVRERGIGIADWPEHVRDDLIKGKIRPDGTHPEHHPDM